MNKEIASPARPSLLRQVRSLGSARVAAALVSALWLVVAARHMTLDAYGDFTQIISLSVVLTAAADCGLSMLLAHDVARWPDDARSFLRRVCTLRLVIGMPACLLMVTLYWVAASRPSGLAAAFAIVSMLATIVHQSVSVTARGLGNVRPEAVNELGSRLFVFALGFVVLATGGSVAAAVAVYAAADVASAALLWRTTAAPLRRGSPSPPVGYRFRRVALLGATVAMITIYSRADLWLLGLLDSSTAVARYAAPYRIFEGVLIVASTFAALTAPVIARASWHDMMGGLRRLLTGAVLVTSTAAVVGIVLAEPAMELLYGDRYTGTAGTLRILLVASVPSAAALVLMQAAGLLHRVGTACVVALALIANVVGNVVAIPEYGPDGAAWMTLITQFALVAGLAIVVAAARGRPRSPEASLKAEDREFAEETSTPMVLADS